MPMLTRYPSVTAYITKDNSEIRELMHPERHGNARPSLAEARVPVGAATRLHRHLRSEELYHVTRGRGRMTLGAERFDIEAGDTLCIPPGTAHRVENTGNGPLVILCCCSPAYAHGDTELLTDEGT